MHGLFSYLKRDLRDWELPGDDDRTSIIGKTGSGKTTFGLWVMLESRLWQRMPWVVVDFKRDSLVQALPARPWSLEDKAPSEPGIYRIEPDPFEPGEAINAFLERVWRAGETGLFFDESYLLPGNQSGRENPVLRALYTTGRSRKIPIVSLSQRPIGVIRYNFSEASHHVVFRTADRRDLDVVRNFVPPQDLDECFGERFGLPRFWSLWHDVERELSFEMKPVELKALTSLFKEVETQKKWS